MIEHSLKLNQTRRLGDLARSVKNAGVKLDQKGNIQVIRIIIKKVPSVRSLYNG